MCRFVLVCLMLGLANVSQAATFTLSQASLLALDYSLVPGGASLVSATPNGDGVEFRISLANNTDSLYLVSSIFEGSGYVAGMPITPGDSLALDMTLLSTSPSGDSTLTVGSVINLFNTGTPNDYGYNPERIGGAFGNTLTAITATFTADSITTIGFRAGPNANDTPSWPEGGGEFRLLINPTRDAIVITPVPEPATLTCVAFGLGFAVMRSRKRRRQS
jgi:hypothetical protein